MKFVHLITLLVLTTSLKAQRFEEFLKIHNVPKLDPAKYTCRIFTNHENSELCSSSLVLSSNHLFTEESGCEGRSNSSYGRWKSVNDTLIELIPDSNMFIISGVSLSSYKNNGCNNFKIQINDVTGNPIKYFRILLSQQKSKKDTNLSNNYRNPINQGGQIFETNDLGELEINLQNYDSLTLINLKPFVKEHLTFSTLTLKGKSISIQLSIHRMALAYNDIDFKWRITNQSLRLWEDKIGYITNDEMFILRKEIKE